MTSSVPPILVTGATGRLGGTGGHVAAQLHDRGIPVRAMVHRIDERSDALRNRGIEVVVGDFGDYTSMLGALDGVEAAYFTYPVGVGLAQAAGMFAAAGRERSLRRIVDLSLDAAFPESRSPQGRANWVAERIFEWAGYCGTHLRIAAFFMENLLSLYATSVRESGLISNAYGDFEPSWIAGEDVGAVAAALLADHALATDRTTVVGAAGRAGHAAIADALSAITGRPVTYRVLSPEEWHQRLLGGRSVAGARESTAADHLVAQSIALPRHSTHLVNDDITRLTGRRPITVNDFLERHRDSFLPTDSL